MFETVSKHTVGSSREEHVGVAQYFANYYTVTMKRHTLQEDNRVKGEIEEEPARLPFEGPVIARPSLLTGDRAALGQPARTAERIATAVRRLLGPPVPGN
jgi:hypothetical protein